MLPEFPLIYFWCLLPTTSLYSILSMSLLHYINNKWGDLSSYCEYVCLDQWISLFSNFQIPWLSLDSGDFVVHSCFISCSLLHLSIVQNLWYIVWYFRFLYNLTLLKKFDISQQSLLFCSRSLTHHSIQTFFNLRDNPKIFSLIE